MTDSLELTLPPSIQELAAQAELSQEGMNYAVKSAMQFANVILYSAGIEGLDWEEQQKYQFDPNIVQAWARFELTHFLHSWIGTNPKPNDGVEFVRQHFRSKFVEQGFNRGSSGIRGTPWDNHEDKIRRSKALKSASDRGYRTAYDLDHQDSSVCESTYIFDPDNQIITRRDDVHCLMLIRRFKINKEGVYECLECGES